MIDLILLAAGNSRRFRESGRGNKLLNPWKGRPMYRTVLERWKEASEGMLDGGAVYVVSREYEILEAAEQYGMIPVYSPESAQGISWSVRNGLCAARRQTPERTGRQADHYVFGVADQPMLTAATIRRFLEKVRASVYAWPGKGRQEIPWPFRKKRRKNCWAWKATAAERRFCGVIWRNARWFLPRVRKN